MKVIKLSALMLGAALFLGLGASSLSAEGMKCGAGKCGSAMKAPQTCNDKKCGTDEKCVCEEKGNKCTCTHNNTKKAPPKAMKCGTGKCG